MKTRKSSKENSEIQQAMVAEETSKRPRLTINPIQYSKDPRVNEAIKKDIEASRRTLAWLEAQEQVVHPLGYVGDVLLYDKDFNTLLPNKWVNDNIINSWIHILNQLTWDCICFSTFTVDCRSSSRAEIRKEIFRAHVNDFLKKKSPAECRGFVFPINVEGSHWTLLYVDLRCRYSLYIDSMPDSLDEKRAFHICEVITTELHKNYSYMASPGKWQYKLSTSHFRQSDGSSCGVFVCKFAESLCLQPVAQDIAKELETEFDVQSYRRHLRELIQKSIHRSLHRRKV